MQVDMTLKYMLLSIPGKIEAHFKQFLKIIKGK